LPDNLLESQLTQIWQRQLLAKTGLVTEGGEPVEIIYPGRINDDRGADFRDAIIATGRRLIKGDIELHIKSSGWLAHQHHRDVAYNRVILHVVLWHNSQTATILENGAEVPVLALHRYLTLPIEQWSNLAGSPGSTNTPCFQTRQWQVTERLTGLLDRAGEARFLAKSARFQTDLRQTEASQSLYQGIMGALGYSKNKLPCQELAHHLPLHLLESVTRTSKSDEECLARQQSLLLGTAGLLPSQCQDGYPGTSLDEQWLDRLERLWSAYQRRGVMSHHDWHLFKVRPNNAPERRLLAMSYLILRYRQEGLLAAVVNMVKAASGDRCHRRLAAGLVVTTEGSGANHFNFGLSRYSQSSTLLGSGRAADIIVNVLLPFTFAWSQFTAQPELAREALSLYQSYPRLPLNTVERHMMRQLGLDSTSVNSARRQQGLIHIYRNRCAQGQCNNCPLSQLEVRHDIQI